MEDLIALSTLNDFIFCPYSIYLHNVYMETETEIYHAVPQERGSAAHEATDKKTSTTKKGDLMALSVCCVELGIYGKIDVYHSDEKKLIERKYQLKQIYKGQYYQLWGEYFCMKEMGYDVQKIAFYEISTNRMIDVPLPGEKEKQELKSFIDKFKNYDLNTQFPINPNKCSHCIYCNLCDKNEQDNVYT